MQTRGDEDSISWRSCSFVSQSKSRFKTVSWSLLFRKLWLLEHFPPCLQDPVMNFLQRWKKGQCSFWHSLRNKKSKQKRSLGQNAMMSWILPFSFRVDKNLSLFSSRNNETSFSSLTFTSVRFFRTVKGAEQLNFLHKHSNKALAIWPSLLSCLFPGLATELRVAGGSCFLAGFVTTAVAVLANALAPCFPLFSTTDVVLSVTTVPHPPMHFWSFRTKILHRTNSTFITWRDGTKSYCLIILLLWESVRLCDKSHDLHDDPWTILEQIWRYGHLSDLHLFIKCNWQTCGRLQATMFLTVPFECFSSPNSSAFHWLSSLKKLWEKPQVPSQFPSM